MAVNDIASGALVGTWTQEILLAGDAPVTTDAAPALADIAKYQLVAITATGVTPYVTLSYGAPEMLEKIDVSPVIDWTLDEIMLVIGGGQPYRYEVIGRWPLLPEIDPPQQQFDMF